MTNLDMPLIETKNLKKSFVKLEVLKGIDEKIYKGEVVSIIGPSGGGKTTLCNLIARFWDVDAGRVTLGGVDVKEYSMNSLMSNFSFVFQSVYLFADTIENNIKFGRQDASHEEVVKRMGAFPENFVVAVKDEQIVGFINGGTTDKPVLPDEFYHDITLHRKDGEIQTVFGLNVIPEYRHQGIAGELVEYFKELAKERGKKALILTCKEHMIPFYESHGLKKLGVADSCHGGATWYDMQIWF